MKASLSAHYATLRLLPLLVLAVSCGEDDPTVPGGGGGPRPRSGVFIDSPVQGLSYVAGAGSAVTGSDGGFSWAQDSNIQFSVGDIELPGPHDPWAVMSPVTIAYAPDVTDPTATNVARFLQTIDDDGDPSNGILITPFVRAAAAGRTSVFFTYSIVDFENDSEVIAAVAALTAVTTAGPRSLVDAAQAQAHMRDSIRAAFAGVYSGNYCINAEGGVTKGGTWSLIVGGDGMGTLEFVGAVGFSLVAEMGLNGLYSATDGASTSVIGGLGPEFSGTWYSGASNGSFSESTNCRE